MRKVQESIVTLTDAVKNLAELVAIATPEQFQEGLSWYSTAHTEAFYASQAVDTDFETFCKVVAILSPSTFWTKNIEAAKSLVTQFKNGTDADNILPTGTAYYANQRKAFKVLSGELEFVSSGTGKTFSFFNNIFNPSGGDFITVDYHAFNGATNQKVLWQTWHSHNLVNKATYSTISEAFRIVATQYNIFPLQAQAICWIVQKSKTE